MNLQQDYDSADVRDADDLQPGNVPASASTAGDILGFDLVSLSNSAAQLRSGRLAFADDSRASDDDVITFSAFNELATQYCNALCAFGLRPGERVLVTGCMSSRSFVAIIGCLAAGLDTAVAGLHLDADDLAAFAASIGATAIISEAEEDEKGYAALVLQAAAQADTVRLVISLADRPPDGSIGIAFAARARPAEDTGQVPGYNARLITRTEQGAPAVHMQQTLITAGLDFISQAQISAGASIVSTIIPASFAGLVCGPIAALLTGASMVLHVPFNSKRLIERVEALKPVQLVIPAALAPQIATSHLYSRENLASLVLLSRFTDAPGEFDSLALPSMKANNVAISDLLAFGEIAAFAEKRNADGAARIPLQTNHTIHMDGREILAVRPIRHVFDTNGMRSTAIELEGAAVSKLNWKYYEPAA